MTRAELPKGERRLLEIIERCDFTGQGCYPTQKELTFLAGFKNHRYTNRLVKSLEAKGFLTIEKRRRPKCKWTHNVYHVTDWRPNVRRGICNLRREWPRVRTEQEAREAESGSERTATTREGANAPGTSPSMPSNALPARCAQAREPKTETCRRPSVCDCPDCQSKIRQLAEANAQMALEASGLLTNTRHLAASNAAYKAERTKQAKAAVKADSIRMLLADWRKTHPRSQTPEGGTRWDVAAKALTLMDKDPAGPLKACLEALEGARLAPWQEFDRRYPTPGPGRTRRDDLENILGNEVRIERCRAVVWMVNATEPEKLRAWYEATNRVAEEFFRRWIDAGMAPSNVVDINTRRTA